MRTRRTVCLGWSAGFDWNVVARSVTVWVRCAVRRKVSGFLDVSELELALNFWSQSCNGTIAVNNGRF